MTYVSLASRTNQRGRRAWSRLTLIGLLAGLSFHAVVAQEPSPSDQVAWNRMFRLSDGRVFVTDGAMMLDASLVKPTEHPSGDVMPSAPIIERYFTEDRPDEVALTQLAQGERPQTYQARSGITLSAKYVDYLRRTVPATSVRLRMKGDLDPVLILADGKVVGLVMPIKR